MNFSSQKLFAESSNELLKVDVEPNNNIRVYEQLKGNLTFLKHTT